MALKNPKLKWLILPPAAALVLFLGPFQAGLPGPKVEPAEAAPAATATPESPSGPRTPKVQMPDAWQVVSTLLGVLLLGGAGIVLVARLRNGAPRNGTSLVHLRQSLRLGNKQQIHAVEFEDEILLLGECDGKLTVMHRGSRTEALDEAEVTEREQEDGAVPKDLVIPRPERKAPAARPAPRARPQRPGAAQSAGAPLSDFRALLRRVKAGQS